MIKEPLKFEVTLKNESVEPIRIADISTLNRDMRYLFYEIRHPDGRLEYRKSQTVMETVIYNSHYDGEPLGVGESVTFRMYPAVTHAFDASTLSVVWGGDNQTFKTEGEYRLRLAYYVPQYYKNLWRSPSGVIFSNQISLYFQLPSPVEKEILDAIWNGSGINALAFGDDFVVDRHDETALQSVIEKYPEYEMTRYARFYLAKSLTCSVWDGYQRRQREAASIFERMRISDPEFRFDEVHICLGQSYIAQDEWELAASVATSALEQNPLLASDYEFMKMKLRTEADSDVRIYDWLKQRRQR